MKLYLWKWAVIVGVVWAVCLGVIHAKTDPVPFYGIDDGILFNPPEWKIEPYSVMPMPLPDNSYSLEIWEPSPLKTEWTGKEIGFRSDGVVVWRKRVSK